MSHMNFENVYQEALRLPIEDQLNLISKLAFSLKRSKDQNCRKLGELQGLGKEIWQAINSDKYLADLRKEWDRQCQ